MPLSTVIAAESIKVDFDTLERLVLSANQHVVGAKLQVDSAGKLQGHLTRSFLPQLNAHIGGERLKTGPFSQRNQAFGAIEARWNLFRGGRDYYEEKIRKEQTQASTQNFQQTQLFELTKARKAYWTLVYQRELIKILEDGLIQNENNLKSAVKRIQAGLVTETDRLEFEMYRSQLEQDLARLRLGASNSERNLSILLGYSAKTKLETSQEILHHHRDTYLDTVFDAHQHRDVLELQANENVWSAQAQQTARWWTPSVDVFANYSLYTLRERDYEALSDRYEYVVGVQLSMSLFDGLQSPVAASSRSLKAEGIAKQAQQTANELAAQFEGAKQELKLTHDLLHASERSVQQAKLYFDRTQSEYVRGVKNSPDVFAATQKMIELRRRFIELKRDYQLAESDLLAMLGK